MNLIDVSLGQQLKSARIDAGYDLSTAAAIIDVEDQVLCAYEDGRLRAPARHLFKLAHVFGVKVSSLFERL